jgi:hypothetical protein
MAQASAAVAALPEIRASARNPVPSCVTPERLMLFLRQRNGSLDPRFRDIARYYKQHGERYRVRWDYAFYQMAIETNFLTFRAPSGRMGDVHPRQNNFAGIGATGGGVPGDSYPNVSTGVLAQTQHLVVYSGERLASPVAPRTQLKMDEILMKSQALGRSVNFDDLSGRWAADRSYGRSIEWVARGYRSVYCAGGVRTASIADDGGAGRAGLGLPRGAPPARASLKDQPEPGPVRRAAASPPRKPLTRPATTASVPAATERPADKVAAPPAAVAPAIKPSPPVATTPTAPAKPAVPPVAAAPALPSPPPVPQTQPSGQPTAAAPAVPPGAAPGTKPACKVFKASYGGTKSVLIEARKEGVTNYTVLDVIPGRESEQVRAFVAAHAQGGKTVAEFNTNAEAMKRAFELCPKE